MFLLVGSRIAGSTGPSAPTGDSRIGQAVQSTSNSLANRLGMETGTGRAQPARSRARSSSSFCLPPREPEQRARQFHARKSLSEQPQDLRSGAERPVRSFVVGKNLIEQPL